MDTPAPTAERERLPGMFRVSPRPPRRPLTHDLYPRSESISPSNVEAGCNGSRSRANSTSAVPRPPQVAPNGGALNAFYGDREYNQVRDNGVMRASSVSPSGSALEHALLHGDLQYALGIDAARAAQTIGGDTGLSAQSSWPGPEMRSTDTDAEIVFNARHAGADFRSGGLAFRGVDQWGEGTLSRRQARDLPSASRSSPVHYGGHRNDDNRSMDSAELHAEPRSSLSPAGVELARLMERGTAVAPLSRGQAPPARQLPGGPRLPFEGGLADTGAAKGRPLIRDSPNAAYQINSDYAPQAVSPHSQLVDIEVDRILRLAVERNSKAEIIRQQEVKVSLEIARLAAQREAALQAAMQCQRAAAEGSRPLGDARGAVSVLGREQYEARRQEDRAVLRGFARAAPNGGPAAVKSGSGTSYVLQPLSPALDSDGPEVNTIDRLWEERRAYETKLQMKQQELDAALASVEKAEAALQRQRQVDLRVRGFRPVGDGLRPFTGDASATRGAGKPGTSSPANPVAPLGVGGGAAQLHRVPSPLSLAREGAAKSTQRTDEVLMAVAELSGEKADLEQQLRLVERNMRSCVVRCMLICWRVEIVPLS